MRGTEREMHRLRMIPARLEAERLIAEKFGMEMPADIDPAPRNWAADAVDDINREIEAIEGPPDQPPMWRRLWRLIRR